MLTKRETFAALLMLLAGSLCGCQSEEQGAGSGEQPDGNTHSVLVLPPETEKRIARLEKSSHELTLNFVQLHSGCQKNLGTLDKRLRAIESKSHDHSDAVPSCARPLKQGQRADGTWIKPKKKLDARPHSPELLHDLCPVRRHPAPRAPEPIYDTELLQ